MTLHTSPLLEAISQVLKLTSPSLELKRKPEPDESFLITSYGNKDDFEMLWDLQDEYQRGILPWLMTNKPRTIIVVWDRFPEADENFRMSQFVTPFDWALACSWQLLKSRKKDKNSPVPELRIIIFDLKSQEFTSAFSCQQRAVLSALMPWIHIYRPSETEGVEKKALPQNAADLMHLRAVVPPGSFGLSTLLEDVASLHREASRILSLHKALEKNDYITTVESLTKLWQGNLIQPERKHGVGNLLAPIILIEGLDQTVRAKARSKIIENKILRRSLLTLIDVIDFAKPLNPQIKQKSPVPNSSVPLSRGVGVIDEAGRSDFFGQQKDIKFLLVDDQYDLGYHQVLAYLLFGESCEDDPGEAGSWSYTPPWTGWQLHCEKRLDSLLAALANGKVDKEDWSLPRKLNLDCDILLLDLRLWTNEPERKRFFDNVLSLCHDPTNAKAGSLLPTQKIDDQRFHEALLNAREFSVTGKKEAEIAALGLLPLLLSHYDPSLPIILFSSTHQRAVTAMLAHRPNIITDFTKPIFSGYGAENDPQELLLTLKRALVKAIRLHETRCIWNRVVDFSLGSPPAFALGHPNDATIPVYNCTPSVSVGSIKPFYVHGPQTRTFTQEYQTDDYLKRRLAREYTRYIQAERYYDFASVPWELIEGGLCRDYLSGEEGLTAYHFQLHPGFSARNLVSEFLEHIRNKKTHGNSFPPANERADEFRKSAILLFLFLMDFLEEHVSPAGVGDPDLRAKAEIYIRLKYDLLGWKQRELRRLKFDPEISWFDYIIFRASIASSAENGIIPLSKLTLDILGSLSPKLENSSISSQIGEKHNAYILQEFSARTLAMLKDLGELVWMDNSKCCPRREPGDMVQVSINNVIGLHIEAEEISGTILDVVINLPKYLSAQTQRPAETDVAAWLDPIPQNIRRAYHPNPNIIKFLASYSSHIEAHRAVNDFPYRKGVRIYWSNRNM